MGSGFAEFGGAFGGFWLLSLWFVCGVGSCVDVGLVLSSLIVVCGFCFAEIVGGVSLVLRFRWKGGVCQG